MKNLEENVKDLIQSDYYNIDYEIKHEKSSLRKSLEINRFVSILTDTSNLNLGENPQTVAGRNTTPQKFSSVWLNSKGSHKPLYLLYKVKGTNGWSSSKFFNAKE